MGRRHRKSNQGKPKKGKGPSRSRSQKGSRRHQTQKRAATQRGRVQKHARGFAFVVPLVPGTPDGFVPPDAAAPLMEGDVVEYSLNTEGGRTVAHIHEIQQRVCKFVLGVLRRDGAQLWVEGQNGEYHRVAERPRGIPVGDYVVASIEEYPTASSPAKVVITSSLGPKLLAKHDYLISQVLFGLETEFEPATLLECEAMEEMAKKEIHAARRRDLRSEPFVTIDGADAKDFDDAVLVKKGFEGSAYTLFVAIADVTHFVRPGTSVDKDALKRGTSVYFPGFCLPMLPETLSNGLCSLRPREDKLAMTAEIHYDRHGKVIRTEFYPSVICTTERLTYHQVQQFFDEDPQVKAQLEHINEPLRALRALFRMMAPLSKARGVLDFSLPECHLELGEDGVPTRSEAAPRWDSHKLIEQFMIAANQVVAKALREANLPTLYRVHEAPSPEAVAELNNMLKSLGFEQRIHDMSSKALSKILEKSANNPSADVLHQKILRLQKQAHYSPQPDGHFGLALQDYGHFTSPIRRYPDIVMHRALKQLIAKTARTDKSNEKLEDLAELGTRLSELERRADEAERHAVKRKQCWFMMARLGEVYPGRVTGLNSLGCYLTLSDFCIEGFLSTENLGGHWEYQEDKQLLIQRPSQRKISVGTEIDVQVVAVDVDLGRINLGPSPTA